MRSRVGASGMALVGLGCLASSLGSCKRSVDFQWMAGDAAKCFSVDCCPEGSGLRAAVDSGKREFLCRPLGESNGPDCFADHGTQRSEMHACPDGTYIRGFDGPKNVLVCCFDRARGYTAFADGETKGPMGAACTAPNVPSFVTGIHLSTSQTLCRTLECVFRPMVIARFTPS